MEILLIQKGYPLWDKTISYAQNCSWNAGSFLADKMKRNDFFDWERVIIATEQERIIGFCSFTEKDALPEYYDFKPFIGFVFVDENRRGNRVSERMIDQAVRYAEKTGFSKVYLTSDERGLYEKYGFEKIGDYETIHGTKEQLFQRNII
ncbi:MAG: GNAT family N-acetyltransferase [Erysipelotrichaceae bacterium]|nr:GNAT family N-acetyltransferase [Erysipelotrichaceae bacterium]